MFRRTAWIGLDSHGQGNWRWLDGSVNNATWNAWSPGKSNAGVRAIMEADGSWSGKADHNNDYVCELGELD